MSKRKVALVAGLAGTAVIRWDSEWQEYTVILGDNQAGSYHTESASDALATAGSMAQTQESLITGQSYCYLGAAGASFLGKVQKELGAMFDLRGAA